MHMVWKSTLNYKLKFQADHYHYVGFDVSGYIVSHLSHFQYSYSELLLVDGCF